LCEREKNSSGSSGTVRPELLGLIPDVVKQMLADIDTPGLERPKPKFRVAASKST